MFACNPLDIVTEIILESLCAAGISFFTRHRHIAAQHKISSVRDERLMGPAFRVVGEVVSEEPDKVFSTLCQGFISFEDLLRQPSYGIKNQRKARNALCALSWFFMA